MVHGQFLYIADAMTFHNGETGEVSLWNDEEGFYFDAVSLAPHVSQPEHEADTVTEP